MTKPSSQQRPEAQPGPLTDAEYAGMMDELDSAGAWMANQLKGKDSLAPIILPPPPMGRRVYRFDDDCIALEHLVLETAERILGESLPSVLKGLKIDSESAGKLFQVNWRAEDRGVLVERLGEALEVDGINYPQKPDSFQELGLGRLRRLLPDALLSVLPVDQLPDVLRDRRMGSDLGL